MSRANIYKKLHEITTLVVKDINTCIKEFNETFNKRKLIDYIIHEWQGDENYKELLKDWNEVKTVKKDNRNFGESRIGYRLAVIADLIKEITGVSWMTFMVQDPQASENLTKKKFLSYNFGMNEKMRKSWDEEIDR